MLRWECFILLCLWGLLGLSEIYNRYLSHLYSHCSIKRWKQKLFQEWIYQRRHVILAMAFFTKQFFLKEREDMLMPETTPHGGSSSQNEETQEPSHGAPGMASLCSTFQKLGMEFKVAWEVLTHSPEGICPPKQRI